MRRSRLTNRFPNDRWRQVLSEVSRIDEKHIVTLESGMSETDEVKDHGVRLVIPAAIHETYLQIQRERLLNLTEFIDVLCAWQD